MNAPFTAQQAAAQIVSLINSRPTSPREDEIAAIIARLRTPDHSAGTNPHKVEWDAHCEQRDAAWAKHSALPDDTPEETAVWAEAERLDRELDDCTMRALKEPVRGPGDVHFLARIVFRVLWDKNLTDPNCDEALANGPEYAQQGICLEVLGTLLRGIRDTLGESPKGPKVQAWRDSPVRAEWVKLRSALDEATAVCCRFRRCDEPGYEEAEAARDAVAERISGFARRVWAKPVRDLVDLIPRGLLVEEYSGGPDEPRAYTAEECSSDVCDTMAIAHLLEGIRQLAAGT